MTDWIAIAVAAVLVSGCQRSASGADPSAAAAEAAAMAQVPPPQWWTASIDFTSCYDGGSPADKAKSLLDIGETPTTLETKTDAVGPAGGVVTAVAVSIRHGEDETAWNFYRVRSDCEDAAAKVRAAALGEYRPGRHERPSPRPGRRNRRR
ncbi:MAG: hypothetical protein ACRETH_12795 [Steroidobacteraceae bacterium]